MYTLDCITGGPVVIYFKVRKWKFLTTSFYTGHLYIQVSQYVLDVTLQLQVQLSWWTLKVSCFLWCTSIHFCALHFKLFNKCISHFHGLPQFVWDLACQRCVHVRPHCDACLAYVYWFMVQWNSYIKTTQGTNKMWSLHSCSSYAGSITWKYTLGTCKMWSA